MLPLSEPWYRRLLAWSIAIGIAAGSMALVYSAATTAGLEWLFGEPTADVWSGRWWWMIVVPAAAIAVDLLRRAWDIPEQVPGAIAMANRGWVEPDSATALVAISALSLIGGASLGPSFGVIVAGGGLAAAIARRTGVRDEEDDAREQYALTGMAGGLGGVFSAPLFATILSTELSSIRKANYVSGFIPQFTAATLGYVVFFGVSGAVMLDAFEVEGYEFALRHLPVGVLLGLVSVVVLLGYVAVDRLLGRIADAIDSTIVRGMVGGALIGLLAFALPLTATGGSAQLAYETGAAGEIGAWMLAAVLAAKVVAVVVSLKVGFLGGVVFPMLFIGGTSGLLVHALLPEIPASLAVAAMVAAVPGATIGAPVGFILIGFGGVGVGIEAIGPIGIAVLTSYVTTSAIMMRSSARRHTHDPSATGTAP